MTTTTMKLKTTALLALALGTTAVTASASDWGFSIGFGRPAVTVIKAPAPARTVREWVPDRIEKHDERVLAEPGHYIKQITPAVTETRYDRHGHATVVVLAPERCTEVWVPDRYETRCVEVVIPGYYREVTVNDYDYNRYDRYDHNDRWDRNDRYDHRDQVEFHGGYRDNDNRDGRDFDNRRDDHRVDPRAQFPAHRDEKPVQAAVNVKVAKK
jgi:hypothetical protein